MGFEVDTRRETPHGTAAVRPSLTADPAAPPRRTGSPGRPTGENLAPTRLVSTTMVVLYSYPGMTLRLKVGGGPFGPIPNN